jgi:hypothetical protein
MKYLYISEAYGKLEVIEIVPGEYVKRRFY